MAKRSKKSGRKPPQPQKAGPVPLQIRVSPGVHATLKQAADRADISVNQLVQGVLQWSAFAVRQGRPVLLEDVIEEREGERCVWFGEPTMIVDGHRVRPGNFIFALDFSDQGALRTTLSNSGIEGLVNPLGVGGSHPLVGCGFRVVEGHEAADVPATGEEPPHRSREPGAGQVSS
jgi:hypothetical protein